MESEPIEVREAENAKLKELVDSRALPKAYVEHPVVKKYGLIGYVFPMALFMDGVAYALHDSLIGVCLVNLMSGKSEMIGTIRKAVCCTCGCKGWCTFCFWYSSIGHWLR